MSLAMVVRFNRALTTVQRLQLGAPSANKESSGEAGATSSKAREAAPTLHVGSGEKWSD